MEIRLSGHGAYHHEFHIVWIPKYDVTVKSPSMGTMMTSNEVALFNRAQEGSEKDCQDASSSLPIGCRLRHKLAFYEVIKYRKKILKGELKSFVEEHLYDEPISKRPLLPDLCVRLELNHFLI